MRENMFRNKSTIAQTIYKPWSIFSCCVLLLGFSSAMAQTAQEPMPVDAIYANQVENFQKIVLTGSVEAKQQSQLGPLEAGRVEILNFEIGDTVSLGQPLLTLNNQLAKLEVLQALAEVKVVEVNVEESERLYKEAQKLSEQKMVAKTLTAERSAMVSSAKAQLAKANADLNLQKERLNRHVLKAPFDGVVTQRNADVGEWITQQSHVLTLVAQNDLRLSIEIPQQYYYQLSGSNEVVVSVTPDFKSSQSFSVTLSRIVPVSNNTTRTFLAQIDIRSNFGLVPGMSAKAEISVPNSQQSKIVLPRSAIKQHPDGGSSIFIAVNNRAKRILVNYTIIGDDRVAIDDQSTNQISTKVTYIISGVELLQDGMPIKVNLIEAESSKGAL